MLAKPATLCYGGRLKGVQCVMAEQIDILLPVHNGGKFLAEQLDSLESQAGEAFRILIRNDASTDDSAAIIEDYRSRSRHEVVILPDREHRGVIGSVNQLLAASDAPYVMFCDQDDIWLADKVAVSLSRMRQLEDHHGRDCPLQVFTDKQVVASDNKLLHESFMACQNLHPAEANLSRLLLQNVASACTMMVNRATVELCGQIPSQAVMHDHWISLLVMALGRMDYVDKPTMRYRQHEDNYYGARQHGWGYFVGKLRAGMGSIKQGFLGHVSQAEAFLNTYRDRLSSQQVESLEAFVGIPSLNRFVRWKTIRRYGFHKCGFRRNAGLMFMLLVL